MTSTTLTPATTKITKKGWFADPTGQHKQRFHNGVHWTEHTTHFGPVPCLGCGAVAGS